MSYDNQKNLLIQLSDVNQFELENGSEIELWLTELGAAIREHDDKMRADI